MTLNKKGARLGAALAATALLASACGGEDGKKGTSTTDGKKGGQLSVLLVADFEHLDPQRNYVVSALNFGRLLYRQLTTYKSEPGPAGSELAPDLATDLGQASDDAKTWTFTLKEGLKYEDGSEIKASDIKHGVERSMSPLIDAGPQYAAQYIEGGTEYDGPYSGKHLDSIIADDAKRTITFKLSQPHGDFPYTVSLPTFAPVPPAKDTRVNYDNRVFSSGPYKIKSYARGKSLELERNTFWGNDDVRKALPDTITATMNLDPNVIDKRLMTSAGADANAVQLDSSIQVPNVAKAKSAAVKPYTITGTTGFLRYIAMNTTKGPLKEVKVRQALQYAINKQDQQTARGGADAAGDLGSTILVPNVAGHQLFDAYDAGPTGDPTKAKQLLAEAGYPTGFKGTLATSATPKGVAQATAFQTAMKRIGVTIEIKQIDASVYFNTIGDSKKQPEFVVASWGPDWPNASTVIPPLFDGRQIKPLGNQNFSQLNDEGINAEMDRISKLTDVEESNTEWGKLDKKIMEEQAPIFPLLYDKAIFVFGKNVTGAFMHSFFGQPDMAALGVKS